MLKLIHDLCGERLVTEIKDRTRRDHNEARLCVIVGSPLLHAALAQHGRHNLPHDSELLTVDAKAEIVESTARVIVVDGEPRIPTFRTILRCPPDDRLVASPARAILTVLEHLRAQHLIEAFDGPVVSALRVTLRSRGLAAFVEEILALVHRFSQGDVAGVTASGPGSSEAYWPMASATDKVCDQSQPLAAFLERVRQCPDPHAYTKALLSCFSYLKSNKNATRASKELNISRTTLHEHLRLASEFRIATELESQREIWGR